LPPRASAAIPEAPVNGRLALRCPRGAAARSRPP
jgi:hypothetical protein